MRTDYAHFENKIAKAPASHMYLHEISPVLVGHIDVPSPTTINGQHVCLVACCMRMRARAHVPEQPMTDHVCIILDYYALYVGSWHGTHIRQPNRNRMPCVANR